jgi:hypothetical protein
MLPICIYGFPLLGFMTLGFEIFVWFKNCRHRKAATVPIKAWSIVIGLLLAGAGLFIQFPIGPAHKMYGFPFPVGVFELTQQGWQDYLPGRSFPTAAILLNALVFGLLPQFWLRRRLAE